MQRNCPLCGTMHEERPMMCPICEQMMRGVSGDRGDLEGRILQGIQQLEQRVSALERRAG